MVSGAQACSTIEKILALLRAEGNSEADGSGKTVSLDGPIRVEVESGDGKFTAFSDGMQTFEVFSDMGGGSVYKVTGDGKRGDGVAEVVERFTLTVMLPPEPDAAGINLTGSAPVAR